MLFFANKLRTIYCNPLNLLGSNQDYIYYCLIIPLFLKFNRIGRLPYTSYIPNQVILGHYRPLLRAICEQLLKCGSSSVVERGPSRNGVVGSNPASRFICFFSPLSWSLAKRIMERLHLFGETGSEGLNIRPYFFVYGFRYCWKYSR